MTCYACQSKNDTQNSKHFKFVERYDIHFMWYPSSFSQSRLGNNNSSNVSFFLNKFTKNISDKSKCP